MIEKMEEKLPYNIMKGIYDLEFPKEKLIELGEAIFTDDCYLNDWFEFVNEPKGEKVTEKDLPFEQWISQTRDGEDSYHGTIYIKLKQEMYLSFGFWC